MIRYFFISASLHALVMISLVLKWGVQTQWDQDSLPMTVEILSLTPGDAHEVVPPKRKKPQKKTVLNPGPEKKELSQNKEETIEEDGVDDVAENSDSAIRQAQLTYAQELNLYILRNQFYPRAARRLRQTGVVRVKVVIGSEGQFRNVELIRPSNHARLNQAAMKLIKNLGKFKPLPEGVGREKAFIVPIAYKISGGA